MNPPPWPFFEFFAGGGMARIGLGSRWRCTFANDVSQKKASAYRALFGEAELKVADVAAVTTRDLPGAAVLAWASFPCQDLSLAGGGAGLAGKRSGAFRPFWRLIDSLVAEGRAPRIIVLENVIGALSSHQGSDFTELLRTIAGSGYRAGALVIDAIHFVPQSRPRLFILAVNGEAPPPGAFECAPSQPWHTNTIRRAFARLPEELRRQWIWWKLPPPRGIVPAFSNIVEEHPADVVWHSAEQTARLIRLMNPLHGARLREAQGLDARIIGTIYKRTRCDEKGAPRQRAEVRFDQVSGCLRTPAGGSSRQFVIVVEGAEVRTRLLSAREAARLMGVPESYPIPKNYNDAYHLFGDGVVAPAVSWLEKNLLGPLAAAGT